MLCLWLWSSAGVAHHGVVDLLDAVPVSTLACLGRLRLANGRVVCLWSGRCFWSGCVVHRFVSRLMVGLSAVASFALHPALAQPDVVCVAVSQTACFGFGSLCRGRLVYILSPLVRRDMHGTHAHTCPHMPTYIPTAKDPLPKLHRSTAPSPPFQNTVVHPTTTQPRPLPISLPQHPAVNPAGQGEKGGRPCRCRCNACKARPRRPHRSSYSASLGRDARRSQAAKPAGQRRGEMRGPILLQQGGLPGCTITQVQP